MAVVLGNLVNLRQDVHQADFLALVATDFLHGRLHIGDGVGVAALTQQNVGLSLCQRRLHLPRHLAHIARHGVDEIVGLLVFLHLGVASRKPNVGCGFNVLVIVLVDNVRELLDGRKIVLLDGFGLGAEHLGIVNPAHKLVLILKSLLLVAQFFAFFHIRLGRDGVFAHALFALFNHAVHIAVRRECGLFVAIDKHGQHQGKILLVGRVDVIHTRLKSLIAIEIDIVTRCNVVVGAAHRCVFGGRAARQQHSHRSHTQKGDCFAYPRHIRFFSGAKIVFY